MYKKRIKEKEQVRAQKVLAVYLVGILIFSIFIGIAKNVRADGTGNYPPPENGDWIIGDNTHVWDETREINGNITIIDGGNLTLDNVTLTLNGNITINSLGIMILHGSILKMNCSYDGDYIIEVKDGGAFHIFDVDNNPDTTEDRSNLTSNNTEFEYKFLVDSGAEFIMKNSELSECGYFSGEDGSAGMTIKTNDTIIENSFFYNNYWSIYVSSSGNSKIIKNTFYSNDIGIYLYSSDNNKISDNYISDNGNGIRLFSSLNNEITENSIYSNNMGLSFTFSSNNNQVTNNNISYNEYRGIEIMSSDNNQISNNEIYSNDNNGFSIISSNSNTITENIILSNNESGIFVSSSSNNQIIRNDVSNNKNGINTLNSNNNQIINSTISGSIEYEFYIDENSNITAINTTFNKDKVYFEDENSNLFVQWYLDVKVEDIKNEPIFNGNITVENIYGVEIFDEKTNIDGWKRGIICTEYIQNKNGKNDNTPHKIIVEKEGYYSNLSNVDFRPPNNQNQVTIIKLYKLPKSQIGYSVSYASDINNDGFDDVIVGAPFDETVGEETGAVYLFYGYSGLEPTDLDMDDANVTLYGTKDLENFGYSVSSAGDVNNDGYDDIIVGAPNKIQVQAGGLNAEYFHYQNGADYSERFNDLKLTRLDTTVDFEWGDGSPDPSVNDNYFSARWTGYIFIPEDNDYTFYMLADDTTRVEIDGVEIFFDETWNSEDSATTYLKKGLHEIIAEMTEGSGGANAFLRWESSTISKQIIPQEYLYIYDYEIGSAYLFYGNDSMNKTIFATQANATFLGNNPSERFGTAVSGVGDVNNDDFDDFLISAVGANQAHLYFGTNDSVFSHSILEGEKSGEQFGFSISSAGDVNNDTYADIIIGAPDYEEKGRIYLFYGHENMGQNLEANSTITGDTKNSEFGFSVDSAGDMNGDGFDDIIIGAPEIGKSFVYFGGDGGIDYSTVILDTTPEFQTGTGENVSIGNGEVKISISGNIVPNGNFDDGWDNWFFTENEWNRNNAVRHDTSTPNGMVNDTIGDWKVGPGGGPTAGFGSNKDTIGGSGTYECSGMIRSGGFVIPSSVDYLHLWYHWKCRSFDEYQGTDGFYLKIFDATNDQALTTIKQHYATSLREDWEEEEEIIFDISAYHGYTVYIGLEIRCNDGQNDQGLAQIDDVYSCDSEGNKLEPSMYGNYTSKIFKTEASIKSVIPTWEETLNDGEIIIKFRADSSVSWDDAQVVKNNELLKFDSPGKEVQFRASFSTTNNTTTPILHKISFEYFSNKNQTIIEGESYEKFGYAVSGAGDINMDGYNEILIGAPLNNLYGKNAGAVYVFYGEESMKTQLTTYDAFSSYYGEEKDNYFGFSVSTAGNVNEELMGEIIIGAPKFEIEKGKSYLIGVKEDDVGVMIINTPKPDMLLNPEQNLKINATIANFGLNPQVDFKVNLKITSINNIAYDYSDEITISSILFPGKKIFVNFDWMIPEEESYNYAIRVFTTLIGDMESRNDEKLVNVKVRGTDFWTKEIGFKGKDGKWINSGSYAIAYEPITIVANITNIGDKFGTNVNVSFFDEGILIDYVIIDNLSISEVEILEIVWNTLEVDSEHEISVQVDPNEEYIEYDEDNNILTEIILVKVLKPDFMSIDLDFKRNDGKWIDNEKHPIANKENTIIANITNIGDKYGNNVNVSFFDDGDLIDYFIVDNLSISEINTLVIPWNTSKGGVDHEITVHIDPDNEFGEYNEINNIMKETIYVTSDNPENPFIFWAQVNYNWGSKDKVVDAPVTVINMRSGEILVVNRTSDDPKGKCRIELDETQFYEGDMLDIIATNPIINEGIPGEEIPEGTYFNSTTIYAYSDDSKDDMSEPIRFYLKPYGLIVETILDEMNIKVGSTAKYSLFIKVAPGGNENENVFLELPNIPEDWTVFLTGDGVSSNGEKYMITAGQDYKEINLVVIPSNDPSKYVLETDVIATIESHYDSKYILTFTTKLDITNITLKIDEDNITLNPGERIIYDITIANKGTITDQISLIISGNKTNWASLSATQFTMTPGHIENVELIVEVPETAEYPDIAQISLYAISIDGRISETITTMTYVKEKIRKVELSLEDSISTGNQTTYLLKIENIGDFDELINLEVNSPTKWEPKLNDTDIFLGIGDKTLVTLTLQHPSEEKYWGDIDDILVKAYYEDKFEQLQIIKPPYANIALKYDNKIPNTVTIESTITADASFSKDEDISELEYSWDFGDGTSSQEEITTHKFDKAGNYTIILTVTDEDGLFDIMKRDVKISNYYSPIIKVNYPLNQSIDVEDEIIIIEVNDSLILDASESYDKDGYIVNYIWNFGNTIKYGKLVYWNYSSVGDFEIILTIEDNYGKTSTPLTIFINVTEPKAVGDNEIENEDEKEKGVAAWLYYSLIIIIVFLFLMVGVAYFNIRGISNYRKYDSSYVEESVSSESEFYEVYDSSEPTTEERISEEFKKG